MKRLLGLAVTLSLLLISFIKNAPATASAGGWDDGFSIADLGVPTGLVNGGNLDCSYVTFKSRYVFNEKIINNKLTYDSQTYETTGRDYPDVCSVQNDHGIIGSNGLWAKDFNLEKALPITSAPYSLSPIPGGNSVLFFDSAPGGGLEYSINHSLGYLGSLSTVTYGRGVSARKEKIWKIDTSKLDQFLTYSNASVVGIDQVGFSSNGRFMVAQLSHRGLVRIELQTKELVPFYAVNYANGVGTYLQISNDGRYVSSYKTNTDQFYIHDISGCSVNFEYGLWPATGVLPTDGCKSTKYFAELQLFNPTVDLINGLRFSPNGASLRVLARFRNGSAMVVHELRLDAKAFTSSANGYLAMGDSYSSGEGDTQGAYWYEEGTDKQGDIGTFENRNLCHLSRRSYPYLSAVKLGYLINNLQQPSSNDSFHSVACSGAKMHNIIGGIGILELGADISDFSISDNQYLTQINAALELWQPGINSQKDYLQRSSYRQLKKEPFNPEIITIGIGGNDAGFGQKLAACLMPGTCEFATSEDKRAEVVEELAQERDNLTRVYKRLKIDAPDARIYVVGYPQFVTYPMVRCGINVQLNEDEVRFVHSAVSYFNQVIASAASSAGVTYVDIENSLSGKNLCSGASDETIAFNGVTAGNDRGLPLFGAEGVPYSYGLCVLRNCIGSESFHPNQRGHEIFSDEILRQTSNLNAENPNPLQTEVPLSEEYFGLSARSFVEALNDPNSEQQLRATFKEMITDLTAYRSPTVHLEQLLPYSTVEFTIHSEPVSLGSFQADSEGVVDVQLEIPDNLPAGYHELYVVGIDEGGENIESYESLMIGGSGEDFDGDEIENEEDSCPTVTNLVIDADEDGIDDACDLEVNIPVPLDEETGDDESTNEESETTEQDTNQNGEGDDNEIEGTKGIVSEETVAGNESTLITESGGAVLGTSTDISAENTQSTTLLVSTGQSAIFYNLLGLTICLISVTASLIPGKDE